MNLKKTQTTSSSNYYCYGLWFIHPTSDWFSLPTDKQFMIKICEKEQCFEVILASFSSQNSSENEVRMTSKQCFFSLIFIINCFSKSLLIRSLEHSKDSRNSSSVHGFIVSL